MLAVRPRLLNIEIEHMHMLTKIGAQAPYAQPQKSSIATLRGLQQWHSLMRRACGFHVAC